MEVIRFKSVGDMSGEADVHRSHYHIWPVESRHMDADDGGWPHKSRDHAPGKWASCKLLGFRPKSDKCFDDDDVADAEEEEVVGGEVRYRFKSSGDSSADQRESRPSDVDASWMLMLASLAKKPSDGARRGEESEEEDESWRASAPAKWRASRARRRKVAAKLARLALSSPALAVGRQPTRRRLQVQGAGLRRDFESNDGQQQQRQQQRVEDNGQLGGVGAMIVVADREGATRSSQPMEAGHLEQTATNDSQQQLQMTGDAQHNAASKRQQQQASDNGNDFAFASLNAVAFDRDSAGVGIAMVAAALPQSRAQVKLGIGAAGEAPIGENANACAPPPTTTTLEGAGNILPVSRLAKQQQQQSSAAADCAGGGGGDGEARAQSKQQVSHAHEHRQRHHQHHSSRRSQEREREQRKVDGGGGEGEGMGERNLAAAADSGRMAVEMVGQRRPRGALIGRQQADAGKEGNNEIVASNASAGKLAELNFGAAANRLVDSLCSAGQTWRQALQPPSHTGTYKVAQRQQRQQAAFAISGSDLEAGENSKQEIGFAETMAGQQPRQATATATTGRHVRRHPRPGRSPISLQRQTNARLAKHRAKIQQQRQEQLTLLAVTGRQQLGGHQLSGPQEQEGGMSVSEIQQLSNVYIINDRLPTIAASSSSHQQYRSSSSRPSTSSQALEQNQQQPQVILPRASTAIEICDHQLACTSNGSSGRGHNSSRGLNLPRPLASTARINGGNVIVYKSINMFRNSPMVNESTKDVDKDQDALTISSSGSTLSLSRPFCKICHMGSSRAGDKLISPCKCSGTMQYIHCGCLLKWLEISNRTNEKPMSCELCAHEYSWHKMFNYKHLRWPRCSLKDIFLHIVFVLALGVMIYSAIAPILQRKSQDNIASSSTLPASKLSSSASSGRELQQIVGSQFYHASLGGRSNHLASSSLASDEKLMLLCAASFFVSFFLAIYVQTKARDTLYGLFVKFLNLNQTYYITEYDHGNSTAGKQLLQQQQHAASCPRNYRKSGQEELINS